MSEIDDCYSVKEAAKILQKSEMTIKNWCRSGILSSAKRGKEWRIDRASVERILVEKSEIPGESNAAPEASSPEAASVHPCEAENRIIIGNRTLSRPEAERVIKQEEAIKRQRENLIKEGAMIDASLVRDLLETHYASLCQLWEELIDVWCMKLDLPATTKREMIAEYKIELVKSWRKLKNGIAPGGIPDEKSDPGIHSDRGPDTRGGGVLLDAGVLRERIQAH